jgi:hypothetical protein
LGIIRRNFGGDKGRLLQVVNEAGSSPRALGVDAIKNDDFVQAVDDGIGVVREAANAALAPGRRRRRRRRPAHIVAVATVTTARYGVVDRG